MFAPHMEEFNPEPESEDPQHGPVKPFLEHLEDLRWVLVKIATTVLIALIGCFYLCPKILILLQAPLKHSGIAEPEKFLKIFGPAEAFSLSFQIALYAGLVISSPLILYFIASFILPALTRKEQKYIAPAFWLGSVFFLAGVCFCYFLVLPMTLKISVDFAKEWLNVSVDFWTAESYISFVTKFMLGMGVAFELPLVVLVLVRFGVLTYDMLRRSRRYVIVLNFILGAVLTTPEVFTQLIMAIPLTIMYEACIWIAWFMERSKKKKRVDESGVVDV